MKTISGIFGGSLLRSLMWRILMVGFVPFLAVGFAGWRVSSNLIEARFSTNAVSVAESAQDALTEKVSLAKRSAVLIARLPDVRSLVEQGSGDELVGALVPLKPRLGVDFIAVSDANGSVIAGAQDIARDYELAPGLRRRLESGAETAWAIMDAAAGPTLRAAARVSGNRGQPIGTIEVGLDLGPKFLQSLKVVKDVEILLITEDTVKASTVEIGAVPVPALADVLAGTQTARGVDLARGSYRALFRVIRADDGQPIIMGVLLPLAPMLDALRTLLASGALILLIAAGLTPLVAYRLAKTFTAPLRHLADAVTRIRTGDFSARVVPRPERELQVLAEGFNGMVEAVARRDEEKSRESERLLSLYRASTQLAAVAHTDALAETIVAIACDLLGADAGEFHRWDSAVRATRSVASRNLPEVTDGNGRVERSLAAEALRSRETLLVGDYPAWSLANPAYSAAGVKAAISAPIGPGSEPIGAISVFRKTGSIRFEPIDGQILGLFTNEVAAVLATADAFERQREAAAELQKVSQAKTDFVSIVSHELRTPLTVIQGFSELIRDEDLTSDEVKEFAGDMNRGAQRLGRLINDMLDLGRLESGRTTLELERVDLNQIMTEVAASLQQVAPAHTLKLALDPGMSPVWADRDKLTQVVTNLVSNAVKYAPNGGDVLLQSQADGTEAHVLVQDRGLGIPRELLERVFEPYARIETGEHRDIQGTGLGLPIVRQIVELHRGRVWAESEPGEGSAFHFTLPLAEQAPAA